jgi:hypothetical protein
VLASQEVVHIDRLEKLYIMAWQLGIMMYIGYRKASRARLGGYGV